MLADHQLGLTLEVNNPMERDGSSLLSFAPGATHPATGEILTLPSDFLHVHRSVLIKID